MRWKQGRRSTNIDNRQGRVVKSAAGGGGILLVVAVVVLLMGGDPTPLISDYIDQTQASHHGHNHDTRATQGEMIIAPDSKFTEAELKELTDFVSVILGSTEDVWNFRFNKEGQKYREPKLVLFTNRVQSACGIAGASTGPFYCPSDEKVYIDLSFYHDLKNKMNAPGDFAQAYVIAHEVGHHIQNIIGVLSEVEGMKRKVSKKKANELSVRVELQADCFAGVWAREVWQKYDMIEQGDIDEALNAASQIGDDRLQKQARGYVVPDSFTHGTSEQRRTWFKRGFESGTTNECNTFSPSVI